MAAKQKLTAAEIDALVHARHPEPRSLLGYHEVPRRDEQPLCLVRALEPDAEQVELFNGFMTKRGWRDAASEGLVQQRREAGLGHREDLVTFFDLMDTEEGRAP